MEAKKFEKRIELLQDANSAKNLTPPGGGDSHMKQTGLLVVSLRGVNFWILVSLRVFRAKRQYFMPPRSRLGFREETQNYAGLVFSMIMSLYH